MNREITEFERAYTAKVNLAALVILMIHVPVLAVIAGSLGRGTWVTLAFGLMLIGGPGLMIAVQRDSPRASLAIAISAMGFSALGIHVAGGMIEAHFHLFAMIAVLIVFGRVLPLIAAGVTIALHHVLFWLWLPASVFNYQASFGIVALHAMFVVFELVPACWIASQFGRSLWARGMVNGRLHQATNQVSAAATRLTEASTRLGQSASRQSAALDETSTSSVDIAKSAVNNEALSANAMTLMETMNRQIERTNSNLSSVQTTVTGMTDSSRQISKVIKLIDEIAFQTNILSLNASIEAARAGEFGAGFAVVANEVRGLANRSAAAATDTANLIESALKAAKDGAASLHELVTAMSNVTVSAGEASGHMQKIRTASMEQTKSTGLIQVSLKELRRVSHETTASVEETAVSGSELSLQTVTLREIVEAFE